jgi:hypothetical protein
MADFVYSGNKQLFLQHLCSYHNRICYFCTPDTKTMTKHINSVLSAGHITSRLIIKVRLKKYTGNILSVMIPLLLLHLLPATTSAQMFSVGSAGEQRNTIPENSFYFGIEPASVQFYGDAGASPDLIRYDFEGTLYRLRYETNSLQIFGAFGSSLSDNGDVSFRNVGIQLQGSINLYTRPSLAWTIPLFASTDYFMMRNSMSANTSAEFSQNRLLFGAGQELVVRPAQKFRFRSKTGVRYGVSASSFGSSVGTAFAFDQQFRVYFDRLAGPVGFTLGFDYSHNRFMTAEDQFKYTIDAFTVLAGISF